MEQKITYCSNCGVPDHLHATCCGWQNAALIIHPKSEKEKEWQAKWREAHPTFAIADAPSQESKLYTQEERDVFAISFCAWYSHAEDAQVYKEQHLSAYQMLELYKSRPFLRTDSPESN